MTRATRRPLWAKINTAAAVAVFGVQAAQGLLASGWLILHRVPAGQATLVTLWSLTCAAPLMVWVARSRRADAERSLRRLYGWTATLVVAQLLQVPMTKALFGSVPLYAVMVGVLIAVSELVRVVTGTEAATEPATGGPPNVEVKDLRSHR